MLLPQFSLRTTLKLLTLGALFCLIVSRAVAGAEWALVISVAVAVVIWVLLVQAACYVVLMLGSRRMGTGASAALTRQGGIQLSPDEQYPPPAEPPAD